MAIRIFFKPARQVQNTGDLLINLSLVRLLEKFGNVVILDNSSPAWFIEEIKSSNTVGLSSLTEAGNMLGVLKLLLFSRSSGDDNYFFYPPGHVSKFGIKNLISSLLDCIFMLLLRSFGCKIVTVGFTSGPFDYLNAKIERFRTSLHTFYGVRDQESLELCRKLKFNNLSYFPDLAWAYRPTLPNISSDQNIVVLSFRSNSYGTKHDSNYLRPITRCLETMLHYKKLGNPKIVIAYQVKYDKDAAHELYDALKSSFVVELVDEKLMLAAASELYSSATCVISNRLHVLLLAAASKALPIPLVKLEDNRKIINIYKDNGLGKLILDYNDPTSYSEDSLGAILDMEDSYKKIFWELHEKNTEEIRERLTLIFGK